MKQDAMLRLAQLSDIHITPTDEPIRGMDSRRHFLAVLEELRDEALDLLVISGDLAFNEGETEAYEWIREALADFPVPYLLMMGNHDNLHNLDAIFQLERDQLNGYLCYERDIKGYHLLFLDTAAHQLPSVQQEWLAERCEADARPKLLFMHHPPLHCGCAFMDGRHYLRNRDSVWEQLCRHDNLPFVFCGHYHTERHIMRDGKQVFITPSTLMQIGQDHEKFSIEHMRPGWRMIEWDGEELRTHVHYIRRPGSSDKA